MEEPENPDELKLRLHAIMNLAWIAIGGFWLLEEKARTNPEWNFFMQTRYLPGPFHIGPLLESLRFPPESERYRFYRRNLFLQLARATLPDAFEAVREYCNKKNISDFKKLDWYGFAEGLRDAFNHNGKLGPRGEKKQRVLRGIWRGKQFPVSMIGHEIPMSFFDFEDLIRLINDIGEFIDQLPHPDEAANP